MNGLKFSDINYQTVSFGVFRLYKSTLHKLGKPGYMGDKTIVPILGIQRSGTSMLYWVFERDLNVKVYRESSELSSLDSVGHIRLNPLPSVREEIDRHHVPMVVFKPLVESQRAHELMAAFPGCRVLWSYRHYQDVAVSNLKAFGTDNGMRDLQPLLDNDPDNWRSQNSSEETRETLRRYCSAEVSPLDAAALFWWARMQLYFEQELDKNPKVLLNRYEDLAENPAQVMRRTYAFLGQPYPGDDIVRDVNPRSVGKGRGSRLSPAVDGLCGEMLERLDRLNEASVAAMDARRDGNAVRQATSSGGAVAA